MHETRYSKNRQLKLIQINILQEFQPLEQGGNTQDHQDLQTCSQIVQPLHNKK